MTEELKGNDFRQVIEEYLTEDHQLLDATTETLIMEDLTCVIAHMTGNMGMLMVMQWVVIL